MPHLAPFNWLLIPFLMFLLFLILSSMLWWQFNPSFPKISSTTLLKTSSKWPWC
uniref:ATP synthase F0 subunit 8 n=1 Tax=Paraleonnates uschakovi TaxID=1922336 RepID=A0A343A8R0_9ANNE|nr:ATP synthase F0 subunit 8 [Paraleonnates uschakovi]APG32410.1 ATP synthase F0 subunit 8 [Paraleonnates uschakovi]